MKKTILTLAMAFFALFAFAQSNFPVGMRFEVAEFEQDDDEFCLFKYKDEDGTVGFYLSVGRVIPLLEEGESDILTGSFSHKDEACIWMGADADEAMASLEGLLELLDMEPGTTREFRGRRTNGAERLAGETDVTCVVLKRFILGRRLGFIFASGSHTADSEISRLGLKSLKTSFQINRKLHPDW